MNEIFGLIDSFEAALLEAKKVPFSDKVMVDEKKMLRLIDKMRLLLKGNGGVARKAVDITKRHTDDEPEFPEPEKSDSAEAKELIAREIEAAMEKARTVKHGANEYADYILANLQTMLTKMQKDLVKLEKSIASGRDVIEKAKEEENQQRKEPLL